MMTNLSKLVASAATTWKILLEIGGLVDRLHEIPDRPLSQF